MAVVGAGTKGSGLAQVFATAGVAAGVRTFARHDLALFTSTSTDELAQRAARP